MNGIWELLLPEHRFQERRISELVPFDNVDPWSGDRAGVETGTGAGDR
jgi:hypothetical protein